MAHPRPRTAARGFTLLEICLAVMIALMLIGIAVPSLRGLFDDRALRASFDTVDDLAREAQERSVTERRAYVIEWVKDQIILRPDEPTKADEFKQVPIGAGESFDVSFPAALVKDPKPIWSFWPSGTCEPAAIVHRGGAGNWSAKYDPLNVRADFSTGA